MTRLRRRVVVVRVLQDELEAQQPLRRSKADGPVGQPCNLKQRQPAARAGEPAPPGDGFLRRLISRLHRPFGPSSFVVQPSGLERFQQSCSVLGVAKEAAAVGGGHGGESGGGRGQEFGLGARRRGPHPGGVDRRHCRRPTHRHTPGRRQLVCLLWLQLCLIRSNMRPLSELLRIRALL